MKKGLRKMRNLMEFINPLTGQVDKEWLNNEVEIYAMNNDDALWQQIVYDHNTPVENIALAAFAMVADSDDEEALLMWLDVFGEGINTLAPTIEYLKNERMSFEE